jgi:hypothetical protein
LLRQRRTMLLATGTTQNNRYTFRLKSGLTFSSADPEAGI